MPHANAGAARDVLAIASRRQKQIREFVEDPVAYRIEYATVFNATMLLMNGLVDDFTFAARLKGQEEPLSTLFYLPPNPNVVYSAALMSKAEEMFMTGKAALPDRAHPANDRTGSSGGGVTWIGSKADRDAASGDQVQCSERVGLYEKLKPSKSNHL